MATVSAKVLDQTIRDLGISYPTWLFEPNDLARPRKLADVPQRSRKAQIKGWYRWYWEYGMNIDKSGVNPRKPESKHKLSAAKETLSRMQYDDEYDASDYRVVFKHEGDIKESVDLPDWYEDADDKYQQRSIQRIERKWDDLPIWDAVTKADLLNDPDAAELYVINGLAIPVESSEDLLKKARPDRLSADEQYKPQRAQFEFTDDQPGACKGVVFNGRAHKVRGIIANADFNYNNQLLVGTEYEDLSKEEKLEFFKKKGP